MPAAFRRLCVETTKLFNTLCSAYQPPSGGCVLKLFARAGLSMFRWPAAFRRLCVETLNDWLYLPAWAAQPPSGGCVLKPCRRTSLRDSLNQPPSGGCVLKRLGQENARHGACQPPSGGCVLKLNGEYTCEQALKPAAFRRLCVETAKCPAPMKLSTTSRLQAAVC